MNSYRTFEWFCELNRGINGTYQGIGRSVADGLKEAAEQLSQHFVFYSWPDQVHNTLAVGLVNNTTPINLWKH